MAAWALSASISTASRSVFSLTMSLLLGTARPGAGRVDPPITRLRSFPARPRPKGPKDRRPESVPHWARPLRNRPPVPAELCELTVRIDTGRWSETVLDAVDLVVPDGAVTALLREAGCGTSMAAAALTGSPPAAPGGGEAVLGGRQWRWRPAPSGRCPLGGRHGLRRRERRGRATARPA